MPDKKPIAYLISGFVGSGKTTFARKLEKETGAIRFTKDEWIIRIFGNDPNFKEFDKYDEKMTSLSNDLAIQCLKAGLDVIIDNGFWSRTQRDQMRERIKEIGAHFQFYSIQCPYQIMRQRIIYRNQNLTGDSFFIKEETFDYYWSHFEAMDADETKIDVSCQEEEV